MIILTFWNEKGILYNGVTMEDISFAEERLGIIFPKSYKDLIQQHSGGNVIKDSFTYKESNGELSFGSVYMLNLFEILEKYFDPPEFFSKGLVPFADDGGGNLTCFDYRKCSENPPIVFWVHEDDEGEDIHFVASDFEDLMEKLFALEY